MRLLLWLWLCGVAGALVRPQPCAITRCIRLGAATVALTRENGSNDRLKELLSGLQCVELPCLEFELTEEAEKLDTLILAHDFVVITSPQAAKVFVRSWVKLGSPIVKVVTVGKGTSQQLVSAGVFPLFEPSEALGSVLAQELPANLGKRALYPSSALSDNALVESLTARGFEVTRTNTYDTVPARWTADQLKQAHAVEVVTLASPSTARVWAQRLAIRPGCAYNVPAVVIGPSTAQEAQRLGFNRIVSPPEGSKGVEAWARAVWSVVGDIAR